MKVRPIAFVLPQFHPIPENDKWWGKGFTEWTNVTKAKPLFKGHYQPHEPISLGYYDLRDPKVREAQANLAEAYGIFGFCYYHYWFNGKRLLNEPIDQIIKLKNPDMPFMLCWANENWTRRWDGRDEDILIEQKYSFEDDTKHIRWLCEQIFSDERYIRVDDCPVFVVYREGLFPDISRTISIWRDIAINEYGYKGLYLCSTESFNNIKSPLETSFDATIEFAPHHLLKFKSKKGVFERLLTKSGIKKQESLNFCDYKQAVFNSINRPLPKYKLYRSVCPSFDNTARKQKEGVIVKGSSPKLYYKWLRQLVSTFSPYSKEENFIFINAMNEWAEGNHLEPCKKYGYAYLEATKRATKL
ncbi:glycosyltransferase WbsX family protein [Aestuariivivens sediminicola]|uniref:glycosyltransferase WbsX family protein n=1 Tax=Aestuariivivens sediminicola TaxID=2913560 RepID=UPI001F58934E|nr:glycoside hydrolase family 99-like domain-containing protein [Aestuariivivens sediminicola]